MAISFVKKRKGGCLSFPNVFGQFQDSHGVKTGRFNYSNLLKFLRAKAGHWKTLWVCIRGIPTRGAPS